MTRVDSQLPGDLFFRGVCRSLLTIIVAQPETTQSFGLLSVDACGPSERAVHLQSLAAPRDAKLICRDSATI